MRSNTAESEKPCGYSLGCVQKGRRFNRPIPQHSGTYRYDLMQISTETQTPHCDRCGAELYGDTDFIEFGILWRIHSFLWFRIGWPHFVKCNHCGKKLGKLRWSFREHINFCNKDCEYTWIPF